MSVNNRRSRQQASAASKATVEILTPTGVETMSVQQLASQQQDQPASQPATTELATRQSYDITKTVDLARGRIAVHKSIEQFEETGALSSILGQRFLAPVSAYVVKDLVTGATQRILVYRSPYDVQKDNETGDAKLNADGTAKPKWRYYAFIKNPDGSIEATGREFVASKADVTGNLNMLIALDQNAEIYQAKNGKLVKIYSPEIKTSQPAESEASEQA